MAKLFSISEVARQVGLRPSAIRYYEQFGLLPAPQRTGGQRRYDSSVLAKIAVIQRARETGFSLDEIRYLFFGFRSGVPPSARWRQLSTAKLAELDAMIQRVQSMQELLHRMMRNCDCNALDECGERLLKKRTSPK